MRRVFVLCSLILWSGFAAAQNSPIAIAVAPTVESPVKTNVAYARLNAAIDMVDGNEFFRKSESNLKEALSPENWAGTIALLDRINNGLVTLPEFAKKTDSLPDAKALSHLREDCGALRMFFEKMRKESNLPVFLDAAKASEKMAKAAGILSPTASAKKQ